jgi:preprotein translocase subunit SecG
MPSEAKWAISGLIGMGLIVIGWRIYPVLVIAHVLICFLLVIVVLLQSGKAADLAGAFGGAGSQTAFGPRGAATFLSKATTWCAIMFMITSMTLVLRQSRQQGNIGSILEKVGNKQTAPAQKPVVPAPNPTAPAPVPQQAPVSGTPTPAPSSSPAQPSPAKPTPQAQTPPAQPNM